MKDEIDSIRQIPDRSLVEAEACAWIAQLDGDLPPSEEDLTALREWMSRSPLHREEIDRLSELWGELNLMTELSVLQAKHYQSQTKGHFTGLFAGFSWVPGFAAVLLLAVGIAIVSTDWFLANPPAPQNLVYTTGIGEQKRVVLEDGSVVTLNTSSQMQVTFDDIRRHIHLLKGEAHFVVFPNPEKPFVVHAGLGLVRAIGTAFSVNLRENEIKVIVTEGKVELASLSQEASGSWDQAEAALAPATEPPVTELGTLKADQSATFSQAVEQLVTLEPGELERELSWHEGVLIFAGEPLDQFVEEISQYTEVTIIISDQAIKDVRIAGRFKIGETEAMLEALESSFGIQVSRIDEKLVYLSSARR